MTPKAEGLPLPLLAEGQTTTRNGVCQIDFTRADATPGSPLRNVDNAVSPMRDDIMGGMEKRKGRPKRTAVIKQSGLHGKQVESI